MARTSETIFWLTKAEVIKAVTVFVDLRGEPTPEGNASILVQWATCSDDEYLELTITHAKEGGGE